MKISLPVSMIVLTAVIVILVLIDGQNMIASGGDNKMDYLAFNRGTPEVSTQIMNSWRESERKTTAVKNIVKLDYVLMIFYCIYLCLCLYFRSTTAQKKWLRQWLRVGILFILAGTALDAYQDHTIYKYVTTSGAVSDMRWLTRIKWILLAMGVIPLVISLFPKHFFSIDTVMQILRYFSGLLKASWLFFPALLFILFAIYCFWLAGQGKDIVVAFTENKSSTIFSLNYSRFIFFIAIGFWVYITWYSSRIIAYIKKKKEKDILEKACNMTDEVAEQKFDEGNDFFDIRKNFLDYFPRLTGNACFVVLELCVLQLPILNYAISSREAFVLLLLLIFLLYFINRWLVKILMLQDSSRKKNFRTLFWAALVIFLILLVLAAFTEKIAILSLLGLLLILHIVFNLYINLRRDQIEKKIVAVRIETKQEPKSARTRLEKIMDFFCIPRVETGYFKWFLWIGIIGIILYIACIYNLGFSRKIGPFPFIILAFGVLLLFGNIVTAFSVKYGISFHIIILLLAFFLGMKETHNIRTIELKSVGNDYKNRPHLREYLQQWLNEKVPLSDTSAGEFDVYFVMANGGASRSGYWTAAVLGKLEDASIVRLTDSTGRAVKFSDHVFCLSGTSGGGVGVATFFSLLRNKQVEKGKSYELSAKDFLKQDYFTYTFARMLGPDFFKYIFHTSSTSDRGAALEESFEKSSRAMDPSFYNVPFFDTLSEFAALSNGKFLMPVLFVNTTRMQDGNPGVVTNLNIDSTYFNGRINVLSLLNNNEDISLASGAILGARFPYLSPAGRIGDNYFVDGGYFDNSGAGVVQETIRGIINIAKDDSLKNGTLYKQVKRLHFKILHIVNSPIDADSSNIKPVAPIKNDLFSPLLTIAGAYDMQTTVNDERLKHFISDINTYSANKADYHLISLYEDREEWQKDPLHLRYDKEPPYAMNWFISDTTLNRINKRLVNQPKLNMLLRDWNR
ncbi:patatin-like phospholipase family protein [Danxiaibacter flavus]|uniref:Patatin-like phospholipase family protein n=1 Tax=Danxiaibacter flavus TaxID=3049108 RepID=A0ABV3Z8J7_9BACT|nr:patatin-like phospholipase family protein [Chitinophagaceae bacterium DXS]